MYITIDEHDFRSAFNSANRTDNFSYSGLNALYDHLTALEDDTGEQIELDVIAICCEYSEDSYKDVAEYYGIDLSECDDNENLIIETVRLYVEDRSFVVTCLDHTIVYATF